MNHRTLEPFSSTAEPWNHRTIELSNHQTALLSNRRALFPYLPFRIPLSEILTIMAFLFESDFL